MLLCQLERPGRVFMPAERIKNSQPSNCYEFLARGRQNFTPFFRNYHHVFDAHASAARDVHSGLNRNHHSRPQHLGLPRRQPRRLVNLQAYTMSRRVRKMSC